MSGRGDHEAGRDSMTLSILIAGGTGTPGHRVVRRLQGAGRAAGTAQPAYQGARENVSVRRDGERRGRRAQGRDDEGPMGQLGRSRR